ncbi:NUDIX hydrolase [Candidatus Saccharibacteria bacterium]|nr:NUDIX hydrolase [Candidatus Saccharibacteria bacterium]
MSKQISQGVIYNEGKNRRTDYLFRISIKGLIRNDLGEVLVVKEANRDWWDLPGGGIDHGEDIKLAIAREMNEEASLEGFFEYKVIAVDEPEYLVALDLWQLRIIFEIKPDEMTFSCGEDVGGIAFINPNTFKNSESEVERRIYKYANII